MQHKKSLASERQRGKVCVILNGDQVLFESTIPVEIALVIVAPPDCGAMAKTRPVTVAKVNPAVDSAAFRESVHDGAAELFQSAETKQTDLQLLLEFTS